MNAHQTAKFYGLQGSNQEIVAQLKSLGLTNRPIELSHLLEMLNFRGMLRKTDGSGGQERWQGTLQNLKTAMVNGGFTAKVAAYEMWFSHVTNPRQQRWDTTQQNFAAPFWEMYVTFAGQVLGTPESPLVMPSVEDFQAVASLGGGWKFAGLTPEAYADQVRGDAIESRITNACALAKERIGISDTDEQASAKWAQAWVEAV